MVRLLAHELRSRVKGVVGWGIGLIAFGAVYISVYPQVIQSIGNIGDLPLYEALGMSFKGFESYIASVVINFLPILLGIYAIIAGTGILAGEEDDGTLELVMAQPVSRFQVVTAKAISLAVALILILLVAAIADSLIFAAVRQQSKTTLQAGRLFLVVFSAWPITLATAMMSLFFGAFFPRRRVASTVAAVVLIASYFAKSLSGTVPSLQRVRFLSLFNYFNSTVTVFTNGVRARDVIVLILTALVFYVIACISFYARNVGVGEWPWCGGPRQAWSGQSGEKEAMNGK